MQLSDFKIGDRFTCREEGYMVTDVGSRVVVAIPARKGCEDWEHGPPYALVEIVFDEHDLPALEKLA